MPMGSPLGPTFANIFLSFHETQWLSQCPNQFKPLLYKRYVDDLLIIFKEPSHAPLFLQYLNTQHNNITFTIEHEQNNSLPFLDILITHNSTSFDTSVYRKRTNTLLGTNFFSFTHPQFIMSSIHTLIYRAYNISSNWFNFHTEITYLKKYFSFNFYPPFIIDNHINKFLSKILDPPPIILTAPTLKLYLKIPFLGKLSSHLHKDLFSLFQKHLPQCKPLFIPHNPTAIQSFFSYKDTIPVHCRSSLVYKYTCGVCNDTYIGQTGLHFHQRICKHRGISYRTDRPLTNPEYSAVREHSHTLDHPINNHNFTILKYTRTELQRKILESIYIKQLQPTLNSNSSSLPLYTL